MSLNSNSRPGTKISGQLDHSKMHNQLCGKPAASEIFPHSIFLRDWSQIWEVWQFSKHPYTQRVGYPKFRKSKFRQKKVFLGTPKFRKSKFRKKSIFGAKTLFVVHFSQFQALIDPFLTISNAQTPF